MKKLISWIFIVVMVITLAACEGNPNDDSSLTSSATHSTESKDETTNNSGATVNETVGEQYPSGTTNSSASNTSNESGDKSVISNKVFTPNNKITSSDKTTSNDKTTSTPSNIVSSSQSTSSADLEMEYNRILNELNFEYSDLKHNKETECNLLIANTKLARDELDAKIKKLQAQYSQEITPINRQISELEKKKMEAEYLGSTNSYYATLAKQYQSQINNLNSQITQIGNKYGNQIQSVKKELEQLPTTEELLEYKEVALADIDAWYSEQLKALKDYYGK